MIERTPGRGSYARAERELRWLLRGVPEGLTDPVEILDTYFLGSTLRLRCMRSGAATVYKLGQKVRSDPARPSLVHLTNLYLSEPEFALLRTLGGAELSKTRRHWTDADTVFAVDQFGGSLVGLVLAEIELAEGDAPPSPPSLAAADVTEDDRFSGGRLAALGSTEARTFLDEVAATASSGGTG